MQNFLENISIYRNSYFGLRHAQSTANLIRRSVGDPEVGLKDYGITDFGKEQIAQTVDNFHNLFAQGEWIVFCSDFLRTKQTCEIVCEKMSWNFSEINFDIRLRERFFGEFEGINQFHYEDFTKPDEESPNVRERGIESVGAVLQRTSELVLEIDQRYSGKNVLLVSHGDVLQILECGFKKVSPGLHIQMEPMLNAMLRKYV